MKKHIPVVVAALLLALPFSSADVSAATNMIWYRSATPSALYEYGTSCSPAVYVGQKEIGKSGITRLSVEFQLRSPYDPGYLSSWWTSNRLRTVEFPDDARTFYFNTYLPPGVVWFGNGKTYAVWAKFIGERPSFWRPDVKIKAKVAEFTCDVQEPKDQVTPGGGCVNQSCSIPPT